MAMVTILPTATVTPGSPPRLGPAPPRAPLWTRWACPCRPRPPRKLKIRFLNPRVWSRGHAWMLGEWNIGNLSGLSDISRAHRGRQCWGPASLTVIVSPTFQGRMKQFSGAVMRWVVTYLNLFQGGWTHLYPSWNKESESLIHCASATNISTSMTSTQSSIRTESIKYTSRLDGKF